MLRSLALALPLVALQQAAREEPGGAAWNRFRGPNGTGIAERGTYPEALGPETNVLWERAFPEGHSSPVLDAERVFLTGVEDERLFTYAVERASGETVWKREAPRLRRTKLHPKNHPAAPSAAVDGDTVAVFFDEFGLLAYDPDGDERWRLPLGPFDNVYGMGASPVIVGAAVVLACDQSTNSFLVAVSKRDGRELWRSARPRAVSGHSTPVVRRAGDGRAEVLLAGSFLFDAYDAETGQRRWWVGGLPAEMKSVPVLLGDRLWVQGYNSPLNELGSQIPLPAFPEALGQMDGDQDGRISAPELTDERLRELFVYYDLVADGSLDEPEWNGLRASLAAVNAALCVRPGGEGDGTGTSVLWRQQRGIPQLPSPLVYAGVYYMLADQGGLVTLLDPDSGAALAKERLNALDSFFASPVAGDGKVYFLSETGILTVIAAGREF